MCLACLGGACGPRVGVSVSDMDGRPQIVFINCSSPDRLVAVTELAIKNIDSSASICELRSQGTPTLVGAWTYGAMVPQYRMDGCPPLPRGVTYDVRAVFTNSAVVDARFSVTPEGMVRPLTGGCN